MAMGMQPIERGRIMPGTVHPSAKVIAMSMIERNHNPMPARVSHDLEHRRMVEERAAELLRAADEIQMLSHSSAAWLRARAEAVQREAA